MGNLTTDKRLHSFTTDNIRLLTGKIETRTPRKMLHMSIVLASVAGCSAIARDRGVSDRLGKMGFPVQEAPVLDNTCDPWSENPQSDPIRRRLGCYPLLETLFAGGCTYGAHILLTGSNTPPGLLLWMFALC